MKPYDLINYLTEDLISNHLKDDYCLAYFPDNVRFDSSLEPMPFAFTKDKHNQAGTYKTLRPDDQCWHIFHNNKWLWAKGLPYILRKYTKYSSSSSSCCCCCCCCCCGSSSWRCGCCYCYN